MRGRKSGLLPLELSILETGVLMHREGCPEFHGFLAASRMRDAGEARLLTARGTLYKALDRLERQGLLSSHWEDPDVALSEGRPRRRLYRVAPAGEAAVRGAQTAAAAVAPRLQPGGSVS
jgi:hypothetical protein